MTLPDTQDIPPPPIIRARKSRTTPMANQKPSFDPPTVILEAHHAPVGSPDEASTVLVELCLKGTKPHPLNLDDHRTLSLVIDGDKVLTLSVAQLADALNFLL